MFARKQFTRFILLALCALPLAVTAGPRYKLTVLDGAAHDIKLGGQLTHDDDNAGAFSDMPGVMSDLGSLGRATSRAYGIDDARHIVGSAGYPPGTLGKYGIAFLYADGIMQSLGILPTGQSYEHSRALAINPLGQIVGGSSAADFELPEYSEHGFIYGNRAMIDLGTLGGLYGEARAINDAGVIVGRASTTLDPAGIGHAIAHAFLYLNGGAIDMGALSDEYVGSDALDVNNLGQVVGWTGVGVNPEHRALRYRGAAPPDLNLPIDPQSGWHLTDAAAIYGLEQIAGSACRDRQCHALRPDPASLPEPGAMLLTAAALGMLAAVAARRRSRRF